MKTKSTTKSTASIKEIGVLNIIDLAQNSCVDSVRLEAARLLLIIDDPKQRKVKK